MISLEPGSQLGPYEVRERVGQGGMGVVYRAWDPALHREVALKVLTGEWLHDPAFAERLRREAQIWARLEHPAILPVYFAGVEGDHPFLAVKFVAGGSLADRLRHGPLPFDAAVALLEQVATALDHAHAHGVVHRDVKPANVLLDETGRAYLSDFGLARVFSAEDGATESGSVVGTPAYMAPEQARDQEPGPRADIYSLGCVAYEMLTGTAPFQGLSPVDLMVRHASEQPTPPRARAPHLPPHVESAILSAIAKDPEHRWPTATLFVQALRGEVDMQGVETVEHPRTEALPAAPSDPAADVAVSPPRPRLLRAAALGLTLGAGLLLATQAYLGGMPSREAGRAGPAPTQVVLDVARRALDHGAYPEALQMVELALRLEPGSPGARGLRERVRRAWDAEKTLGLWPAAAPPPPGVDGAPPPGYD